VSVLVVVVDVVLQPLVSLPFCPPLLFLFTPPSFLPAQYLPSDLLVLHKSLQNFVLLKQLRVSVP
jgi:hypothetical protein